VLNVDEMAQLFNPALRGWINYYGKFSPHELNRICWQFDQYLMRWVQHKYKFMQRQNWAVNWLERERKARPSLFAHWEILYGKSMT
jgi:RNA-directed DNA polymerase